MISNADFQGRTVSIVWNVGEAQSIHIFIYMEASVSKLNRRLLQLSKLNAFFLNRDYDSLQLPFHLIIISISF